MKKNNLITFQSLEAQRQQRNEFEKEQFEEDSNIFLISYPNKSDIFQSQKGKSLARKLMSRVNNFYKGIDEDMKDTLFILLNIENTLLEFEEYLLSNTKGKEKQEYQELFNKNDFTNDVKNLLRMKAYEHKQQRELEGKNAFCSPEAKSRSSIAMISKSSRSAIHEAFGRGSKVVFTLTDGSKYSYTDEQLKQILPILTKEIESAIENNMNRIIGSQIKSIQTNNKLTLNN